jgi:hypothetical protein
LNLDLVVQDWAAVGVTGPGVVLFGEMLVESMEGSEDEAAERTAKF